MKFELKDIHKSFGDKEILKGITFSVESGKALGLLGRNGAGKTTTIRTIMDVFHANSGEMFLDGKTLSYVKEQTGKEFFVIKDIYSTKEIVEYVWNLV